MKNISACFSTIQTRQVLDDLPMMCVGGAVKTEEQPSHQPMLEPTKTVC